MAKLKFNRLINVTLQPNQTTTIPKNEVWRFSAYNASRSYVVINGTELDVKSLNGWISEGATFKGHSYPLQIEGIAFKVVE